MDNIGTKQKIWLEEEYANAYNRNSDKFMAFDAALCCLFLYKKKGLKW